MRSGRRRRRRRRTVVHKEDRVSCVKVVKPSDLDLTNTALRNRKLVSVILVRKEKNKV